MNKCGQDMTDILSFAMGVFMAFFAVMNPITNTPLFLTLTANKSSIARRRIAGQSVVVAFCITFLFILAGQKIFMVFGITLPSFKIVGGILIMLIGFESLQGRQSSVQTPNMAAHQESAEADLSIAVSPLGIPLLSGPGTITTAVNFVAEANSPIKFLIVIAAFAALCAMTYVCFLFSREIKKYLGQIGINVVTRLMGLILAVVGVEMLVTGLKNVFPLLR
jgi:multiple antibiotic resistance protein